MASNKLLILATLAIALPTVSLATQFIVGDESGWTINYDYQAWAKDKVFVLGDSLVFNYTAGNHNVFKVNKTAYENCIVPPADEALSSGWDVVNLNTTGNKWNICGVGAHCPNFNQKLAITVSESGAPAPALGPAGSYYYP